LTSPVPSPFGTERLHLFERVTRALHHASGFEQTIRAIGECLVPGFADAALLIVQREEQEDWMEVVHSNRGEEAGIAEAVRPLLPALRRLAKADVQQGREFRWIPSLSASAVRFLRQDPAIYSVLQHLRVQSLLVVPLRAEGLIFGALALLRTQRIEQYSAMDLSAAQVIARRAAVAIQGSELHERLGNEEAQRYRLEDTLQKWIRVFDRAGWGAAIVDAEDQRIEAVNPAFAALHGYATPGSLSGRLFTDLLPPDRTREPAGWRKESSPPVYESLHLRADGSLFPVLTNVTSLTPGPGGSSYVITVQDLTELKRAEERLRRAQRLEAAGRLAGGVAHEVNNMMTIILGFSDLLVRSGAVAPERHRDVEEIRRAATRAGKITQQLLAFSRQQILQPADLQLNDVVQELVPMLKLLLPANVELETSLAPLGPLVRADRAQLDQVIINLAFNARDAMPGGGTLRLLTESRGLDEQDGLQLIGIPFVPGEYALVSVIDTGHGMDSQTLQQVFEPFFTTKPVGSGTGLGLATVYGIVKQSGGYVWVESASGTGTTVTVCLPQVRSEAPVERTRSSGSFPAECRAGNVLVIEDEEGVRELALRILEQQGHRVYEARDGDEAVARLEEFGAELDLVVSDVIVPNIGTTELAQKIRDVRADLPILFMSGYSHEDVVARGLIEPELSFLQKPFTAAELTQLVCRQLDGSPAAGGGE
jgi:two-component system, cell cycle sensor histidine kinase and response regulator CckA